MKRPNPLSPSLMTPAERRDLLGDDADELLVDNRERG